MAEREEKKESAQKQSSYTGLSYSERVHNDINKAINELTPVVTKHMARLDNCVSNIELMTTPEMHVLKSYLSDVVESLNQDVGRSVSTELAKELHESITSNEKVCNEIRKEVRNLKEIIVLLSRTLGFYCSIPNIMSSNTPLVTRNVSTVQPIIKKYEPRKEAVLTVTDNSVPVESVDSENEVSRRSRTTRKTKVVKKGKKKAGSKNKISEEPPFEPRMVYISGSDSDKKSKTPRSSKEVPLNSHNSRSRNVDNGSRGSGGEVSIDHMIVTSNSLRQRGLNLEDRDTETVVSQPLSERIFYSGNQDHELVYFNDEEPADDNRIHAAMEYIEGVDLSKILFKSINDLHSDTESSVPISSCNNSAANSVSTTPRGTRTLRSRVKSNSKRDSSHRGRRTNASSAASSVRGNSTESRRSRKKEKIIVKRQSTPIIIED